MYHRCGVGMADSLCMGPELSVIQIGRQPSQLPLTTQDRTAIAGRPTLAVLTEPWQPLALKEFGAAVSVKQVLMFCYETGCTWRMYFYSNHGIIMGLLGVGNLRKLMWVRPHFPKR